MQTLSRMDLTSLLQEEVDWRFKGFPPSSHSVTVGTVGSQGWNILRGDLAFPLLVLKQSALDHNIELMARFCQDHGVSLAPHGKTPIAPQIVLRQLEAGAWGITAANLHQARVFREFGVQRILIANEVVEDVALGWIADEVARDSDLDLLFLVDSVDGAEIVVAAAERLVPARPFNVLLEWGWRGARAGIRDLEEARRVARVLSRSVHVRLAGIEGYEGAVSKAIPDDPITAIDRFLREMQEAAVALARESAFDRADEIIVTAGGSMYMDRVVEILSGEWNLKRPVRVVLRSGAYVAHDSDQYARLSGLGERGAGSDQLRPALELWGVILSVPEPGLAIAGFGKRDASYDAHLPMPFVIRRDEITQDVRGTVTVTSLNDQHAYLAVSPDVDVAVGDLIGCEISHACTAFDKWHLLPLVADDYSVTGAIRTFF